MTSRGDSDGYTPGHPWAGYPGGAAAPPLGTSRLAIWSLGMSLGGWVSVFASLAGFRLLLFVADPAAMVGVVLGIVALIRIKQRSQNGVAAAIVGIAAGAAILVVTVFMVVLAWANFAQIDEQYRYKQ